MARSVASSHNAIGLVLRSQGQLAAARPEFEAQLAMQERLHAAAPNDSANHRQLGLSHFYLGDLLAALGEVSAARAHFVEALAIGETLAARDPANRIWQQNLARYRARLALATPDQPAFRAQLLDAAVRIMRSLTAADATNTVWTRVLAETLIRRGGALAGAGDLAAAAADADAAVEALEVVRRIQRRRPANGTGAQPRPRAVRPGLEPAR